MNARIIFMPYTLFLIGAIFWALAAFMPAIRSKGAMSTYLSLGSSKGRRRAVVYILWLSIYPCLFLYLSEGWLRAEPTHGWQEKIKTIDTAIILGFGYERDALGHLRAGKSNAFLMQWALEHTHADTLLVQEGGLAAYNQINVQGEVKGKKSFRIHRHIDDIDLNTFQTAYCALEKMEQLGKRKAVLVAHDLQLQRVAWIFKKLTPSRADAAEYKFIVPHIPPTPFPADSDQLRTRSKLLYIFCELFGSRLRDYLSPMPDTCLAPL